MDICLLKCPFCGSVLKDWRNFSEKSEIDKEKPFECTGYRCGKRWTEKEIKEFEESIKIG